MAKKFRYQHIMSAVEGKLPTAEQLKDAEIAVNVFAGAEKLAVKNSNGDIVTFGTEAQMNAVVADAVAPLAVKAEVAEEINAVMTSLQEGMDALDEKKANVEDVPSIEGLAKSEDVTAEIAAAVAPLAVKSEVTEEIDAAAAPLQQGIDGLEAKKVDWTESTPGRKHIVLANHDSVLGTATDGSTYNVAMVSKWDVADFGSAQLHLNLNSKDGVATINDDKQIATVDDVNAVDAKVDALEIPSIEGLAVASEVTAEIAAAVEPLATKAEVNAVDAKVEAIDLTPYATKDELSEAAAEAVAKVVADAPEDLDTLKEVADYIASDKTKAAEIETKLSDLEAKDAAQDAVINGKVDRNMDGANGKALVFNEADGGGAKFEHNDGTWSFAGVNDGGENGIAGQIYAVKKNANGKMEGTRIDVTKAAMYYTVGDAAAADRMVVGNEIATKKDIPSLDGYATTDEVNAAIDGIVLPDMTLYYTKDEVDNMLSEKQAEIDAMAADFKKLKEIVGDLGGAVEYSVPADGKLTDMLKKSGIIKLTEDVESNTYTGGITSKNITTLNLNGKTLTTTANTTTNPTIMVRGTQQFTIQGGGTIDANGHIAIEANGADAVITLGGTMFGRPTYVTNREGELIYCYLGTINITNGVFRNDNENKKFLLNCYDANYQNGTAKIVVTGGKFYDFDPANNTSEGEGTSYVPEGYESVESTETIDGVEHTVYTVKKSS